MPRQRLIPILTVALVFIAYCLRDLRTARVAVLPKWAWAALIVGANPAGGIGYLLIGRREG